MDYKIGFEDLLLRLYNGLRSLFIPSLDNNFNPGFLHSKVVFYGVLFLLVVKIITVGFFIPIPGNIFFADITKTDLLNLANQQRSQLGIAPLAENNILDQAAKLKAQDMVNKGYFSHVSPSGITPWFWFRQVGYNYKYAGENLAVGFFDSKDLFEAWIASPSHKENIVNPNYKEVGTAVVSGFDSNAILVVQVFGAVIAKKPDPASVANKNTAPPLVQAPLEPEKENVAVAANESLEQEVLGNATQINQSAPLNKDFKNNVYLNVMHFIVYDYQVLLQYILYLLVVAVGASALIAIFFGARDLQRPVLVRSAQLFSMICVAIFLDQSFISQIIGGHIVI